MVYVDNMNAKYRGMIMCHMIADTHDELIAMVDTIGVQRKHIQYAGTKNEHFDICLTKKRKALAAGATEVSMMHLGHILEEVNGPGYITHEPGAIIPKDMSMAQQVIYFETNPDWKGSDQITVKVNGQLYLIPHYCLADALGHMPDEFYPCSRKAWAKHPLYLTSVEMVKDAIGAGEDRFKAFIYYGH